MKFYYSKLVFSLVALIFCIPSSFSQEIKWVSFKDEILKWTYQIPDYLEDRRKNLSAPHNFVRNSQKMPIDKCGQCILKLHIEVEDLEGENLNEVRSSIYEQLKSGLGRNDKNYKQYNVEDLQVNKMDCYVASNVELADAQPNYVYNVYIFNEKPQRMVLLKFQFLAFKEGDSYVVNPEHKRLVLNFLNSIQK